MALGQLEGYTVGVTADRRWSEQAELLRRRGATVVHAPTVRTDYLADEQRLRAATDQVIARPPDVLIATTGIGVRAWFEAAQAWDLARVLHGALEGAKVVARGPKSVAALQANDVHCDFSVPSEQMEEVLARVVDLGPAGKVVAFQQYGTEDERVTTALREAGADVVEIPVYRWRLPTEVEPALRLVASLTKGAVDAVTFTSAPAVRNLLALAAEAGHDDDVLAAFNSAGVLAACVGPVCARAARECGIDAPIAPAVGRLGLLVRTLTDGLQPRARRVPVNDDPVTVQGAAVERGGQVVTVSERERVVLSALADAEGAVVPKTVILRRLGKAGPARDMHAVETTVARLRNRLAPLHLTVQAELRRGYRLADKE